MGYEIPKYFIMVSLFFFLIGCIEGIMFPTKFNFKSFYASLFKISEDQIKSFFGYFVAKIHVHVNLLGWVSSALMGILYYIVPVISNGGIYNIFLSYINLFGHTIGLILIITGFHLIGKKGLAAGLTPGTKEFRELAAPYRAFVTAGGICTTISAIVFVVNMFMTLFSSPA